MTARAEPPPIVWLGPVDSTQAEAFARAARGAPDGTAVVAESQRAGRGRQGRAWLDEPGASLLVSFVLRPRLDPARWPLLSLTAAVAVASALHRVAALDVRLKWPNDVLVGGRKIAGILLESRAGLDPVVVVGIGVNLQQTCFPEPLAATATSLRLATGRTVARDALLDVLREELAAWRARLEHEGFAPVREAWLARDATLGRRVAVDGTRGVAVDLGADGALVLADGARRHRVVAGEVVEEGAADAARG